MEFAVLGDSIAYGQGASRPADTIGARLAAELGEVGVRASLRVHAVPGARSDALAAQVRRALIVPPQLALIVIGANDLTHFVPPEQAAAALDAAVRALRGAGAQVVVAPAPDLSAVPWVPPQLRGLVQAGSAALREAQRRVALAAGARVADVTGSTHDAFAADVSLFAADRFHPSSKGYAAIAAALKPAVLAAAADLRAP
ncbi:GDSL-type esterase/lipase family protein [uncultured Jatrophihabitans sp.]|uniref:GDSL-type esterase/lipase family protein n=1 Tax=uncultured Jatrophihabitans sp. TaxID=1610747 RepID=UPI0035CA5843